MSFQVGIGSLGRTVFFQVVLCTPLGTMVFFVNSEHIFYLFLLFQLTLNK